MLPFTVRSAGRSTLIVAALATVFLAGARADDAAKLPPVPSTPVDFSRDIRPLLEKHCLKCHGAQKQLSGLRLDREGDALRGGDNGAAFEVGKSAQSLLIRYIAGLDPDILMPPEGAKLTSDDVSLFRGWIDQGAKWEETAAPAATSASGQHWSFQPVRRSDPPAVARGEWPRNPIDRFVLARLEAEQIVPSVEADRATLARRLSLDLLGLPPSREELRSFLEDDAPDAYERLVDRMLASPHFGERWGRHWLDLARYADSDGYEKDTARPHAWRYRHWLIEAINADLPFDQFTIEQIAGDLLAEATLDQKIATGFHRNTLTNTEGGVDKEEFRVVNVVDRTNTTGSVWLGLTVGCAQCHSHKYDPLTLREYYGLFAFFNQGQEVDLPAPLPQEAEAYAQARDRHDAAHAPFVAAVREFEEQSLPTRQAAWEQALDRSKLVVWTVLQPDSIVSEGGAKFAKQSDGSYLVSGPGPDADSYTVTIRTDLEGITAFRLELLPDKSLPGQGPGRAAQGNVVISEFRVANRQGEGELLPLPVARGFADFSQEKLGIEAAVDSDLKSGWGIAPQVGRSHQAVFELATPAGGAGVAWRMTIDQQQGERQTLGRFRLSATTAKPPLASEFIPDEIVAILLTSSEQRTPAQLATLKGYYGTIDPDLVHLRQAEAEHARQAPAPPASKAQTLVEIDQRRATHIHLRGDFLRKGDEVTPHTPEFLPPMARAAGGALQRLDLARWLVAPENPLTPRVTMNRVWKQLFGQALVASLDDFGTRGDLPSHPELLDWLASEFVGPARWSMKRMIREIVLSTTYRQASRPRPELIERDPRNVLLARQNRFRVEAEVLRDLYLAASGLLVSTVGGPSVRPRQPAGISELTYAGSARWVESAGADRYRRGLYTWFQRTSPYPMLMTFDAPDSNVTCTRRERSNTPLQALTLLNDPVFFECAQALGGRLMREGSSDPTARLAELFEWCLARPPTDQELARLQSLHEEFLQATTADPQAGALLTGSSASPDSGSAPQAAAVALARIILNLDEFVTRE
ncbi:MAG: DUF1553 domain-containing protein [Planctomycetales bacterium]